MSAVCSKYCPLRNKSKTCNLYMISLHFFVLSETFLLSFYLQYIFMLTILQVSLKSTIFLKLSNFKKNSEYLHFAKTWGTSA